MYEQGKHQAAAGLGHEFLEDATASKSGIPVWQFSCSQKHSGILGKVNSIRFDDIITEK